MDEPFHHWESRTKPMPEQVVTIQYNRLFTSAEAELLGIGWFPRDMDDKWVGILHCDSIDIFRSWTGNHIYSLPFSAQPDGMVVNKIIVNNDPYQHRRQTDAEDIRVVEILLMYWLAQKSE